MFVLFYFIKRTKEDEVFFSTLVGKVIWLGKAWLDE